jgi:hypothetical protein
LGKFVRQNKPTRFIAGYFKVSERTIYRRIKEYGLKGIRKHGRKPLTKNFRAIQKSCVWVYVKRYIDKLHGLYHFHNIQYPPTKYINAQTRVCSSFQHNPRGKFTTCTVYYVALESQITFLYAVQYRYSEKAVSFQEIHRYFSTFISDILALSLEDTGIEVLDIIAFHFFLKSREPKVLKGFSNEAFNNADN